MSAVFCAAVGTYHDSGSNGQGLLDVLSGGSWSATEAPLPSDARANPNAGFFSVSCPSVGSCVAVGAYKNSAGGTEGVIDTLTGGHWSTTEAPVPSAADTGANAETFLKSVSCPAPGDCVADGLYSIGGRSGAVGLIDTLSAGQWSDQMAPQPSDANTHQEVYLTDVSCPSLGPCVADGIFETSSAGRALEVLQQSGSSWTATTAPLPGDNATGSTENVEGPFAAVGVGVGLSCATGSCEAVGRYTTTSGGHAGFLDNLSGGTWTSAAAPLPSNAQTGATEAVNMIGVSCAAVGAA